MAGEGNEVGRVQEEMSWREINQRQAGHTQVSLKSLGIARELGSEAPGTKERDSSSGR